MWSIIASHAEMAPYEILVCHNTSFKILQDVFFIVYVCLCYL